MSLLLLFIAFVTTGIGNITNKAIHECGLDAYRDLYLLGFYGVGAVVSLAVWIVRPKKMKRGDVTLGLGMGISGGIGLLFFLLAVAGMQGIVVFPVRNMANVLLTAVISFFAWKEKLSKIQWMGVAVSILCIFLLY